MTYRAAKPNSNCVRHIRPCPSHDVRHITNIIRDMTHSGLQCLDSKSLKDKSGVDIIIDYSRDYTFVVPFFNCFLFLFAKLHISICLKVRNDVIFYDVTSC